jgi:uncharacterized protein YegP (UPF0339 family)
MTVSINSSALFHRLETNRAIVARTSQQNHRRTNKRKQHYFVLKAANHRIIGCSESYSGAIAMEKGIKSVMKNGTSTKINDTTS